MPTLPRQESACIALLRRIVSRFRPRTVRIFTRDAKPFRDHRIWGAGNSGEDPPIPERLHEYEDIHDFEVLLTAAKNGASTPGAQRFVASMSLKYDAWGEDMYLSEEQLAWLRRLSAAAPVKAVRR